MAPRQLQGLLRLLARRDGDVTGPITAPSPGASGSFRGAKGQLPDVDFVAFHPESTQYKGHCRARCATRRGRCRGEARVCCGRSSPSGLRGLRAALKLLAPDVTFRAASRPTSSPTALRDCPTHARGPRRMERLSDRGPRNSRISAKTSSFAGCRQRGTGKLSGADAEYPIFILFRFRGRSSRRNLEGTRRCCIRSRRASE